VETLKLGIVGAGFVAKFHARALKQVRDVEIADAVNKGGDLKRTGTGSYRGAMDWRSPGWSWRPTCLPNGKRP
jgi:predicted dehydrogenase